MTFKVEGLTSQMENGFRVWRGGDGHPVVCLAGPPVSALLYRHLLGPLGRAGFSLIMPDLFHPPEADCSIEGIVDRLSTLIPPDAIVVSHGLALPIAMGLSRAASIQGLVVLDGPLERLDFISNQVCRLAQRMPFMLKHVLFRPSIFVPLLASSVALRRAVINPYVMDRDIVAMLVAPNIATAEHREKMAEYMASIRTIGGKWPDPGVPVLMLWGASNPLYPPPDSPSGALSGADVEAKALAGATLFHIEEQPWKVADAVVDWANRRVLSSTTT